MNQGKWSAGVVGSLALLVLTVILVGCGTRATPTPTPAPISKPRIPTPYAPETPPAGWPPAESLLPEEAWLALRVETPTGERWTLLAGEGEDRLIDERSNRVWVDRGRLWGRYRHLWYALLNQTRFWDVTAPAYLTACQECPTFGFVVRSPSTGQPRGVWLRLRPFDAPPEILPLLPLVHTLWLYGDVVRTTFPDGEITIRPPAPEPTSVEAETILRAVYGDALTVNDQEFRVGPNVIPWVGPVISGAFTGSDREERLALVGGVMEEGTINEANRPYLEIRLVILRREGTTWQYIGAAPPLAINVAQEDLGVVLDSVVDFDGDGRQEVMVLAGSLLPGYLDGVYRLYRWDGEAFQQVWTATGLYDNTAIPRQPDYATQVAWPLWQDQEGDGVRELVLRVIRRTYVRSDQTIAEIGQIARQTESEVIYRWRGRGFMLATP